MKILNDDSRYWGKPILTQRRRRIFLVVDFRGECSREILFIAHELQSCSASCSESRPNSTTASRRSSKKSKEEKYPSYAPFKKDVCEVPQKIKEIRIHRIHWKFRTDKCPFPNFASWFS